jgi:hypothetical protein
MRDGILGRNHLNQTPRKRKRRRTRKKKRKKV